MSTLKWLWVCGALALGEPTWSADGPTASPTVGERVADLSYRRTAIRTAGFPLEMSSIGDSAT